MDTAKDVYDTSETSPLKTFEVKDQILEGQVAEFIELNLSGPKAISLEQTRPYRIRFKRGLIPRTRRNLRI